MMRDDGLPIINTAPTAVLVPNFSLRKSPEKAVAVSGSNVYIKVVSAELTVIKEEKNKLKRNWWSR